jgi:mRNA interferase RelE/StbE
LTKVVLARRARREILDLEWRLADAVEEALGVLEREPESGHRLRGRLSGLWSLRVGSYRILYQLAEDGGRFGFWLSDTDHSCTSPTPVDGSVPGPKRGKPVPASLGFDEQRITQRASPQKS